MEGFVITTNKFRNNQTNTLETKTAISSPPAKALLTKIIGKDNTSDVFVVSGRKSLIGLNVSLDRDGNEEHAFNCEIPLKQAHIDAMTTTLTQIKEYMSKKFSPKAPNYDRALEYMRMREIGLLGMVVKIWKGLKGEEPSPIAEWALLFLQPSNIGMLTSITVGDHQNNGSITFNGVEKSVSQNARIDQSGLFRISSMETVLFQVISNPTFKAGAILERERTTGVNLADLVVDDTSNLDIRAGEKIHLFGAPRPSFNDKRNDEPEPLPQRTPKKEVSFTFEQDLLNPDQENEEEKKEDGKIDLELF